MNRIIGLGRTTDRLQHYGNFAVRFSHSSIGGDCVFARRSSLARKPLSPSLSLSLSLPLSPPRFLSPPEAGGKSRQEQE